MHKDLAHMIREAFIPIFKAYDIDGNSTWEKAQVRNLLADNLGVTPDKITEDQLNWHFDRMDENKDGHISFDEYFNCFFGDRATKCKQNQVIDIKQFGKLMRDTFAPLKIQITQEMVQWNFKQIDTDNSGRIQFNEYLKFIKKYNK